MRVILINKQAKIQPIDDEGEICSAPDAFQRFKNFTRAIIAVPKEEIDEATKKMAAKKPKPQTREKPASK